jgi:pyruvate dehydrogenase E2 component (dihydrolipoamide acetyltransferase)
MVRSNADTPNAIFYLPDLGEGLDEAELIEWCVDIGQKVEENDILAKMETAKALVDVPSPRSGVIAQLHGKPGQAIKVGSPLVTFKVARGDESSATPPAAKPPEMPADVPFEPKDRGTVVGDIPEAKQSEGVQAAPAVRRLARELGVDLATVHGTGIGGRITAQDVQHAVGNGHHKETKPSAPPKEKRIATEDAERVPLRGVRRTIAEHLRFSVTHAVHYTLMDEADVTALDALRRKLIAASNEKISLLPFVAFAVCRVLAGYRGEAFRRLNSTVDDDTQEIVTHRAVHLGIATDTDAGLMVPVIRDVTHLGVLEISRRIASLAHEARDRKLTPNQLTGSTFTISNIGPMGGRFGTPIINYPEAGILAVGRAREGVVVCHGMLGVGKLLPLSLSCDHRVIDGATAAAAMAKIIDLLQTPDELLPSTPE